SRNGPTRCRGNSPHSGRRRERKGGPAGPGRPETGWKMVSRTAGLSHSGTGGSGGRVVAHRKQEAFRRVELGSLVRQMAASSFRYRRGDQLGLLMRFPDIAAELQSAMPEPP